MTRDFIFRNTFKDIERILKDLGEGCGTRFEFECYDVGHLYNLAHFLDRGLVKPPLFVQTIFGILGGIGADPENLMHMKRIADKLFGDDYAWSILAAGRHQMPLVTMGAIMGGNVRVGLEDSLWLGRGQLAKSNAEQVSRIRTIVENLSLEIATPDEARQHAGAQGRRRGRVLKPGRQSTARELGEDRVELLGRLELDPMAGTGDDCEAGLRLDALQQPGALVEMRVGGRVALAPDAVEPRLDLRQRLDQRARARKPAAAHAGAGVVGLLQVERQLVDLVRVGDHQLVQIVAVGREFLGFAGVRPARAAAASASARAQARSSRRP